MLSRYRGKDCMKMLCKGLKGHAKRVIYCEKKEMISLTDDKNESYENQKFCHICKKRFTTTNNKKVKDHCHFTGKYRGAVHNKSNMNYKISKNVPVAFHNGSISDYNFIIKELSKESEGQFECLGEKTEKYISFPVQINKEIIKIDEDGINKIVNIPYKSKFIDSFRFMSTSLSSLVDNLSDKLRSNKCTNCKSSIDYMKVKDNQLIIFKCLNCNKEKNKDFNKELVNRFSNTNKFCNGDINKFVLLLRKGVYPYEYMNSWERFNETSLPNKEDFYSCLNMEDIKILIKY